MLRAARQVMIGTASQPTMAVAQQVGSLGNKCDSLSLFPFLPVQGLPDYTRNTSAKKIIAYLKFKLNGVSCILSGKPSRYSPLAKSRQKPEPRTSY